MGFLHQDEPREKPYDVLTPKEAKVYFEWFLTCIPTAVEYLQTQINESEIATFWKPDYTIESLGIVADWLVKKTWLEEILPHEIEEKIQSKVFCTFLDFLVSLAKCI